MKKQIKFINPITYSQVVVDVGPAFFMMLIAIGLAFFQIYTLLDTNALVRWDYVCAVAIMAHVFHLKFAIRTPFVLSSIALACVSNGVTLFASAILINRFFAESLRNGGWKVSDKEGNFGEYSSRFLAMEEYHFNEGDIMNSKNSKKSGAAY